MTDYDLIEVYPNIYITQRIILKILDIVSPPERSFSEIK
jgi:hypothetical protein